MKEKNNAAYLYSLAMRMAAAYEIDVRPARFHHPLQQFPLLKVVGKANMLTLMTVDACNHAILKDLEDMK